METTYSTKELGQKEWDLTVMRDNLRKKEGSLNAAKAMKANKDIIAYMNEELKGMKAAYKAAQKSFSVWCKANNVPSLGDRITV